MIDFSSPFAPVIMVFYLIGLINFVQGAYAAYKFSNGYGMFFPKQRSWDRPTVASFMVSPDKATKMQRVTLFVFMLLMFSSLFIMYYLIQMVNK